MSQIWIVKTTSEGNQRIRKGVHEFKVACDKCGLVRWVPRGDIFQKHEGCLHGIFFVVAKEEK